MGKRREIVPGVRVDAAVARQFEQLLPPHSVVRGGPSGPDARAWLVVHPGGPVGAIADRKLRILADAMGCDLTLEAPGPTA